MKEAKELLKKLKEEKAGYQEKISRLDPAIEALENLTKEVTVSTQTAVWTHPQGGRIEITPAKRGPYKENKNIHWGRIIKQIVSKTGHGEWTRSKILENLTDTYGKNKVTRSREKISAALSNLAYWKSLGIRKGKISSEDSFYIINS